MRPFAMIPGPATVVAFLLAHFVSAKETPQEETQQIIKRLRSNLSATADRLDQKKDPGDETRRLQEKIIEDLDRLLRRQDPAGQSENGSPKRQEKTDAATRRESSGRDDFERTNRTEVGKAARDLEPGKKHDAPELKRNPWPTLPKRKQQEMDVYSRDRFPQKYEELLREYYRTIAEQDQRRED